VLVFTFEQEHNCLDGLLLEPFLEKVFYCLASAPDDGAINMRIYLSEEWFIERDGNFSFGHTKYEIV